MAAKPIRCNRPPSACGCEVAYSMNSMPSMPSGLLGSGVGSRMVIADPVGERWLFGLARSRRRRAQPEEIAVDAEAADLPLGDRRDDGTKAELLPRVDVRHV